MWLECELACDLRKELLIFLIDDKADWPESDREAHQIRKALNEHCATPELLSEVQHDLAKLAEFRKWLNGCGLRRTFTSPEDLWGRVESALRDWRDRHSLPAPPQSADPTRYLEYLREQTSWIDIQGLRVGSGKPHRFPIHDLYVLLISQQPGALM